MEEGWERPPRVELTRDELELLVEPAFPGAQVAEYEAFASGLANTNIRFRLHTLPQSFVLRLHTRDSKAAARERDLMAYLERERSLIPVPQLVYSDPGPARGEHPYSIWNFVEGRLLDELFKTLPAAELPEIAAVCGRVLASFCAHPFEHCGEFGARLRITEEYGPPSHFVPEVVQRALYEGLAGKRLGAELRDRLWAVVERTSPELRELDGHYSLTHGDYKRSNLLLRRSATTWEVAAVLDWEFAFAGPPLIDVGLFLRAGAALPEGFREAFASGYRDAGGQLPQDWLRLSRLLDLVSQMTFLDDPRDRPRVIAETVQVLTETVRMLA
jgi:aminoglycoside phosphotransferase (APT) family kinase protein